MAWLVSFLNLLIEKKKSDLQATLVCRIFSLNAFFLEKRKNSMVYSSNAGKSKNFITI